jgi:protein-disulfide isomerase
MATLRVPVSPNDHIKGNPDAPVTLVEYGDYECPHCAAAHPVVKRLQQHFGSELRYVYRHFPLSEIHPHAEGAAETAEFAGEHNSFWDMHDLLFVNQDRLGVPMLLAAAETLGLSEQELREALAREAYAPKIRSDFVGGIYSGVNGTPTFFIGKVRHDGPFDYNSLRHALEAVVVSRR